MCLVFQSWRTLFGPVIVVLGMHVVFGWNALVFWVVAWKSIGGGVKLEEEKHVVLMLPHCHVVPDTVLASFRVKDGQTVGPSRHARARTHR